MGSVGRKVLLVDDDEQLIALLDMKFSQAGYTTESATDAEEGYRMATQNDYDALVLDVIMPRQSGLELCERLRAHGVLTPVLILSGQDDKGVVVQGLNAEADDYLTKPFSTVELLARVRALLRRSKKTFDTQLLQRHDVVLDVPSNLVRSGEKIVILTKKEALLLKRLMAESPRPVSRLSLLQDVWGIGDGHASNRLDVYVRRLRTKLRALGHEHYIRTIRGSGYYFDGY